MPEGNSSIISTGTKSSPTSLLISTDSIEKGSCSQPEENSKTIVTIRTGSKNLARIPYLSFFYNKLNNKEKRIYCKYKRKWLFYGLDNRIIN
jgi:hypothetical protein